MICASCGAPTASDPCGACGASALLDGRYRLEARLGVGATGTTWAATRLEDGLAVAIKEMPLHVVEDKSRALVLREADVLAQVHVPGVPRYHEHLVRGQGKGRALWLVMDRVTGRTLAEEAAGRRYTVDDVLGVLTELFSVLAGLHELSPPIVHRDVKPDNVMRREDGSLALVDFGSVKDALSGTFGGSTVAGTFGYMAPEQFRGDATPRSDVYGCGALGIALLTRSDPKSLLDGRGRIQWHGRVKLPNRVGSLFDDLLATDPIARPTAREAIERISALRGIAPAVPAGPPALPPIDDAQVMLAERLGLDPQFDELPVRVPRGPPMRRIEAWRGLAAITPFMVAGVFAAAWTIGFAAIRTAPDPAPAPHLAIGERIRSDSAVQSCLIQFATARATGEAGAITANMAGSTWTLEDDQGVPLPDDTAACFGRALERFHESGGEPVVLDLPIVAKRP